MTGRPCGRLDLGSLWTLSLANPLTVPKPVPLPKPQSPLLSGGGTIRWPGEVIGFLQVPTKAQGELFGPGVRSLLSLSIPHADPLESRSLTGILCVQGSAVC